MIPTKSGKVGVSLAYLKQDSNEKKLVSQKVYFAKVMQKMLHGKNGFVLWSILLNLH